MKNVLLSTLALGLSLPGSAQHEADNWYFGYNIALTFSSGVPAELPLAPMQALEGCASLSDASGNLLFYSNGVGVWDRDHVLMPNGIGLNGSQTCSQSALFTPYPGQDSLFYIFTPPDFVTDSFCYSIVDLRLNGGYGDVTDKNVPLFAPSTEKVTAIPQANGGGIWVIGHSFPNADFYAYHLTTGGIDPVPVISTAGTPHDGINDNKIGLMKASPCGDKIAVTVVDDAFVEVFDFDDATGIVSNAVHLGDFAVGNPWGLYGLSFSPDGSRLYVTQEGNPGVLVQYDLLAGSPAAMVASADTIKVLPGAEKFSDLQMAPDGKIYVSRISPSNFLSSINDPNALGAACTFVDTAIVLTSGSCTHGLPNFMSSIFLTPSTPCEGPTAIGELIGDEIIVHLWPDPAVDAITIGIQASALELRMELMNACGQSIRREVMRSLPTGQQREITLDLTGLAPGMYLVAVSDAKARAVKKFVKR